MSLTALNQYLHKRFTSGGFFMSQRYPLRVDFDEALWKIDFAWLFLLKYPYMRKRKSFIILLIVLIIAAAVMLIWRPWSVGKRPNVVLIVADTLRSDHLPFYGYSLIETPFLSGLADHSILCKYAWSPAPWTAPATASIFTSLYPFQHGLIYNIGNMRVNTKIVNKLKTFRIPDKALTLAETLQKAGYRTFGVSMNINVCSGLNFNQGFDRFVTIPNKKSAEHANQQLLKWEKEIKENAPSFVYIQYMDCHAPYERRNPWYRKRIENGADPKAAYDSNICYLDDQIRNMADRFKWKENTLIIFTSDHGEEFWEHGRHGHGHAIYRESIQVPLMFYLPGETSIKQIQANVSTLDILPTVCDILGLPLDSANVGKSLSPFWKKGAIQLEDCIIFSHLARYSENKNSGAIRQHVSRATIFGKWQAINSVFPTWQFLFDWQNDPLEQIDLRKEEPILFQHLKNKFLRFEIKCSKLRQEMNVIDIDADKIKELKTLGYL
jgi:arylsulfatase A-like enzyme